MTTKVQDSIMLLGDSLTQGGWEAYGLAQRLANAYQRKLDVINRGFSGYNTEWAIPVFEQCFAKQHDQQHLPKVRLLTIWYGANDASIKAPQHVPLATFKANLKRLVQIVLSPSSPHYSPLTKIALITPPPINTFQWGPGGDPPRERDRLFEVTQSYAEAVRDVAKEENVALVDIWTALWDAVGHEEKALSQFSYDGLHLNGNGYGIVFDSLVKVVKIEFPELHWDRLPPVFPLWDTINYQAPLDSLVLKGQT